MHLLTCESIRGDRGQHSGHLRRTFIGKGHGVNISDAGNVYFANGSTGTFIGRMKGVQYLYTILCVNFIHYFSFICKNEMEFHTYVLSISYTHINDKVNRNEDMFWW